MFLSTLYIHLRYNFTHLIVWIYLMHNIKLDALLSNDTQPLLPNDTLKHAIKIMKTKSISSVVIVDEKKEPLGIFTEYDAIKVVSSDIELSTPLQDVMSTKIFSIQNDMNVHDAYILMEQNSYRHLIVTDTQGVYLGVITEGDFLRHMGFEEVSKQKTISDAMSETILTVHPDTSIAQTAKLMSEKKCDYAIILQDEKPIGLISERDITYHYLNKESNKQASISVMQHTKMYIVNKNTSLSEASDMMKKNGVHQLIVIDKNNLIGLITRHDILKALHGSYFDYLLETIKIKTENEKILLKHKEELEKLANYDQLTSLPNRLYFQNYLKKSIAKAKRNKHTLGVVLLDLDRFKDINDSYGHTIGDELLKIVADRLTHRIRTGDLVARVGGDEFAIILEDLTNEDDITKVTKEILETVSETSTLSNGVEIHTEASAGVVLAPKDAQSVEQTMQYADSALYQAKADGHGVYKFYTDEMTEKAVLKLAYETALRNALDNNEFEIYYQPQVHIKTGKIISAEALLRWHYPDKEDIPPSIFIPIAEDTGLINKIGEWVINEACTQGKKWQEKGINITIAVNVSANQVKFQDIVSVITKALKKSAYPANKLEIEITESSLMQREEEIVEILHTLRAKGIRLAIDDFGTGYSSLSYLKRFPIDVLKIDKSFVDDIPYENEDIAIVIAIIEMGKALGYQVLAEGVEHQEQLDFLQEKGCQLYQGYIKSRPVPVLEFEKLIKMQNS